LNKNNTGCEQLGVFLFFDFLFFSNFHYHFFITRTMIEELKDEQLINKVGGRFKLSALIQKRLVTLNKGSRSPVDTDRALRDGASTRDKLNIVIQEILQDKIYLEAVDKKQGHFDGNVNMVLDTEFTDGV
jgi:DNA-directed RNA polymerase subunit omega